MTVNAGPTQNETPAARPWQRVRPPASSDARTPFSFWLTVLGLACVALLTMTWGASAVLSQKGGEKLLRIGLQLPKLKNSHTERKADAFRMSEPEPSELAHPKDRKTSAAAPKVIEQAPTEPPLATPFGPHLIPSFELAPPPVEACTDPVVYLHPCPSHRGDTPMIRNWKTMTMFSLLSAAAVVLVPPPAVVIANDKKDPPVEVKGIDELIKSIDALSKRIEALEKKKAPTVDQDALTDLIRTELRSEIKKLENGALKELTSKLEEARLRHKLDSESYQKQIDKLTGDIASLQKKLADGPSTPQFDKGFIEETRSDLKSIKDALAKIGPTETRKMMAAPINGGAKLGRVMIVNLYHDDLLFLINGKDFVIPAGRSRLLEEIPVGTVQYRVHSARWGKLVDQSTTLAAGETFTLTAAPQR
ncbi:MAG: hypothetical protein HY289_06645 [Planctomycetes bacterium]|nr:hypothetical protein [Planctomycetota bacterium]